MKAKQIFSYILLFALLSIKVSSFHVFSHLESEDTEIENCFLCEVTLAHQQEALIAPSIVAIKAVTILNPTTPLQLMQIKLSNFYYFFRHTSRPPPISFV